MPPEDASTAAWLGDILGRKVQRSTGDAVQGADATLADAMIALRLTHDEGGIAQLRHAAQVIQDGSP